MNNLNENFKVGYLVVDEIGDNNELAGALLVVDNNGYPKEIKCTETVKTSTIQKIAYGLMLRAGVMIDQIALPLINELDEEPDVILVNDKKLLNIQRKTSAKVAMLNNDESSDEALIFSHLNDENNEINEKYNSCFQLEDKSEPFDRVYKVLDYSITDRHQNFSMVG